MNIEIVFGIGLVVLLGISVIGKLIPKRMPPKKSFQCGRCGISAIHNARTAEAWRHGKTKFFCQSCHAKWIESRPSQTRTRQAASRTSGAGGGCLGVVGLFALIPVAALVVWGYFR